MGKLFTLGVLFILAYALFKGIVKLALRNGNKTRHRKTSSSQVEQMVQCSRCGIHMPESESIKQNGAIVCHDNAHCIKRS